jgi:phosphopantothenoylcysteine decarboxylase
MTNHASKEIVIAITGSIAAYKSCDLVRNLTKSNYPVRVIMTKNALNFVGKSTFEALTNKPVFIDEYESYMAHIEIKKIASVFAIVPCSANMIGKMANGIADDLVSSTYLASQCPILIAPAMNPFMYTHPAVQNNLKTLKKYGVIVIEPQEGLVVCGDEGKGKMEDIFKIEEIIVSYHLKNYELKNS